MWTCGIDIATQHDTPATHSSACKVEGEKPSGRSESVLVDAAGAALTAAVTGAVTGATESGRRRNASASGSIASRQNTPVPM